MDYFSLFGLPRCYQIDMQLLSSRFQDLQRQHHPDKFVNGTKTEQLDAVSYSASINRAWETLRNPLTRAEHLLFLYGFNAGSQQNTVHEAEFLMKQLEFHEELQEIEQTRDNARLESFIKLVKGMLNTYYKKLIEQLNTEKWAMAIGTLEKLRFLDKLKNTADQVEEKLLDF